MKQRRAVLRKKARRRKASRVTKLRVVVTNARRTVQALERITKHAQRTALAMSKLRVELGRLAALSRLFHAKLVHTKVTR